MNRNHDTGAVGADAAPAQRLAQALAVSSLLLCLWELTHRYGGLTLDGEIYAIQAWSRIKTYFLNDIYLSGTSQDAFTIFSPLYATFIRLMGLQYGSTVLFALCALCSLAACWFLLRKLFDRQAAFFSVATLICTVPSYGSRGIFHVAEDYLTARSLAEALVIVSLALFYRNRRIAAFGVVLAALAVHPIMALPGLLLLLCVSISTSLAVSAALGGIALLAIAAFAATHGFIHFKFFRLMDSAWLEVVRERSQFLFPKYWRLDDWQTYLRPLLTLVFACFVADRESIRKLCIGAIIVGLTGLALAIIAASIGPVAILLQGQAWRWFWITSVIAIILIAPIATQMWRTGGIGQLCATLFVVAWTFAPVDHESVLAAAIVIWLARSHIARWDRSMRLAAYLLIGVVLIWDFANIWQFVESTRSAAKPGFDLIDFLRGLVGLRTFVIVCLSAIWWAMRHRKYAPAITALAATILAAAMFPSAILNTGGFANLQSSEEYREWRAAIPESSNVLLLPESKNAGFQWYALQRSSYISVSQSAGVVYSPVTSAEIRRRSDVLQPVMRPGWRILSQIQEKDRGESAPALTTPLTAESLRQICSDPILGFVVAQESVGYPALRHLNKGPRQNWSLYDCRNIRDKQA